MSDWRETRKQEINKFEDNPSNSIEEYLKIFPDMNERAKNCGMSTEEYLRYWICNGLSPDARVTQGEK